jgi:PAS domain S-box-containing protein
LFTDSGSRIVGDIPSEQEAVAGGQAMTTDQRTFIEESHFLIGLKRDQVDSLPWAIAKVDRQGVITYGNREMCKIVGVDSLEGRNISDLYNGNDLATVRQHLESRFTGRVADEYCVELTRPTDGLRIPVRCSSMPETDQRGQVVGVISYVRDLLAEDVSEKVHNAIGELRGCRQILEALIQQCQRVVPFDFFYVTLYSADGEHSRLLYLYPNDILPRPAIRWREMTGITKALRNKEALNIPDLQEFLQRPEWRQYSDDPDTRKVLAAGLRSSVSHPVMAGNRLVARVGFGRKKGKGAFSREDQQGLERLPLDAAVTMALHYKEVGELDFALKLIRRIALASESANSVAEILIKEIASHYEWENVSIFQPDEQEGCLWMVKQEAQNESALLPPDFQHPLDKGVTGHVYQTREPLIIGDVQAPKFKHLYVAPATRATFRSELCIPIIVAGRVYWLLNVEDLRRNAFAREEQEALQSILQEVAVVLELTSRTRVFSELLKCNKDAVIQTDFRGIIQQTNPATEELLGYRDIEMKGTPFFAYFKDKEQGQQVHEAKYVPNDEVYLVHKDGSEVKLLLSGTSLPKEIGLKVYVCNDLSTRKHMETLEILRHMYNEIATQIKTPLSLAFTWLRKLRKFETQPEATDILMKTVKQLNKVDLTYERLLFYERHKTIAPVEKCVFGLPFLLEKIKQDIPDSEASQIDVTVQPDVPLVRADLGQLWFCIESILAYLGRFVPEDRKVSVSISAQSGGAVVAISGYAPPVTGSAISDYAKKGWAIHAITEMALGEEMIRSFIEKNHAGKFRKQRVEDDLMEYVIELPGA